MGQHIRVFFGFYKKELGLQMIGLLIAFIAFYILSRIFIPETGIMVVFVFIIGCVITGLNAAFAVTNKPDYIDTLTSTYQKIPESTLSDDELADTLLALHTDKVSKYRRSIVVCAITCVVFVILNFITELKSDNISYLAFFGLALGISAVVISMLNYNTQKNLLKKVIERKNDNALQFYRDSIQS